MSKPNNKPTHYAFDYGILDFLGQTRTKRTLCDATVPSSRIDNARPTCPNCLAIHEQAEALAAILQAENNILHPNGADMIEPGHNNGY